jgi:hypothetical protein
MSEPIFPPTGFDEPFFHWLDWMAESLSIQFASPGSVPEPDLARLEQHIGRPVPAEIRRFYARYNPWGALRGWFGWESTERVVGGAVGATAPLVPIDCRSYSSRGWDTVAVVHGPERYEVVERWRATGVVRRYPDLRSYFIAGVTEECRNDPESARIK